MTAGRSGSSLSCSTDPVARLLPELLSLIFVLLPVDTRLRCAEVSVGWRRFLYDDARLWAHAKLPFAHEWRTSALLEAVSSRARGALRTLDVSGWVRVDPDALRALATANANTLVELRSVTDAQGAAVRRLSLNDVDRLLAAAPSLRTLAVDVSCRGHAAVALLDAAARPALRVATLAVWTSGQLDRFAAAAEAHTSLVGLVLNGAALRTEAALRSYKFSRLSALDLSDCGLTPDSLPALADMLAGGTLTQLSVRGVRGGGAPFTGAHAAAFCAALRGSALTALTLTGCQLWDEATLADGIALLSACEACPRLGHLSVSRNATGCVAAEQAVGAGLARLVPRLRFLDISHCDLGEAGLAPLMAALAAPDAAVRQLFAGFNEYSAHTARDAVLPAVRANLSLRALDFGYSVNPDLMAAKAECAARRSP